MKMTITERKNWIRKGKEMGFYENKRIAEYTFPKDTPFETLLKFDLDVWLKCGVSGGLSTLNAAVKGGLQKKQIKGICRSMFVTPGEAKRLMKQYGGSAEVIHYFGASIDNERSRTALRA